MPDQTVTAEATRREGYFTPQVDIYETAEEVGASMRHARLEGQRCQGEIREGLTHPLLKSNPQTLRVPATGVWCGRFLS